MSKKLNLRAVDFFCGAGGLTCGLKASGIDVVAGIDIESSCKETYEKNNKGAIFLDKDITKYSPEELASDLNLLRNDDGMIFAGCAPCQFWSILNITKNNSKKTKNLILDFQRFVEYFMPGFVIVENVPGISSHQGSPMAEFITKIESLGYKVSKDVTDMSLYGIPQKRKRFTLIASRIIEINLPKPTNKLKTVRDVIGIKNGFRKIEAGTKDPTIFLHSVASLSKKNIERLQMTQANGGDRSIWQNKREYSLACYSSDDKKFHDTYGRMWWDRPSPTITTKFYSISNGRFAHPEENRAISLREGAVLQTFPKDYEFISSSTSSIAKMIGNAVPPEFARIIGEHLFCSVNK